MSGFFSSLLIYKASPTDQLKYTDLFGNKELGFFFPFFFCLIINICRRYETLLYDDNILLHVLLQVTTSLDGESWDYNNSMMDANFGYACM